MNVGKEVAAMRSMTVAELRGKYAEVFGEQTRCRHKEYMVRRIAWRLQANEEGDLSECARKRAMELAANSDVRMTAPRRKSAAPTGPRYAAELIWCQTARNRLIPTQVYPSVLDRFLNRHDLVVGVVIAKDRRHVLADLLAHEALAERSQI